MKELSAIQTIIYRSKEVGKLRRLKQLLLRAKALNSSMTVTIHGSNSHINELVNDTTEKIRELDRSIKNLLEPFFKGKNFHGEICMGTLSSEEMKNGYILLSEIGKEQEFTDVLFLSNYKDK